MAKSVHVVAMGYPGFFDTCLIVGASIMGSKPISGIFRLPSNDFFLNEEEIKINTYPTTVLCDLTLDGRKYSLLDLNLKAFTIPLPDYDDYVITEIELVEESDTDQDNSHDL